MSEPTPIFDPAAPQTATLTYRCELSGLAELLSHVLRDHPDYPGLPATSHTTEADGGKVKVTVTYSTHGKPLTNREV